MSSERKAPTYEELLRQDMSPEARGKSLDQLYTEDLTEEKPLQQVADSIMSQQREEAAATTAQRKQQVEFDAARTSAGDLSRAVQVSTGGVPQKAGQKPRMTGTSPGTKAAANALEALVDNTEEAKTSPSDMGEAYELLSPEEKQEADEAGKAFDIAYKAIQAEADGQSFWDTLYKVKMPLFAAAQGTYEALTSDAPGEAGGAISKAYRGIDPELDQINDPVVKARVHAKVRDILEREGGVEFWQGTDAEDRQSYIAAQLVKRMRVGPNQEQVQQIHSVIDNATDVQFDADATFVKLVRAYERDAERAYREDNPSLGGAPLPDEILAEVQAVAAQKARKDIDRIKAVVPSHVFVDTKANDRVAEYLAGNTPDYARMIKGRTIDPLSVRPSMIDDAWEESTGAAAALPGAMVGATFLGRAFEVGSLQEQGALQFEMLADNVRDSIENAVDPNNPTVFEVAEGAYRGVGQALMTSPAAGMGLRTHTFASLFTREDEDPAKFMMEADARMIDAATDNRDYFDSVAFTLPMLVSAPWGRDAQAEALTTALDYHKSAKFAALVSALVLPDTSPLGAMASATRKASLWAAKKARFAQWSSDLGRVSSVVDTAGTADDFINEAKRINLALGMALESSLVREETQEIVGGVVSTLADSGENAAEALKKAKLGDEVAKAQATLEQMRANNASAEALQEQSRAVEALIQKRVAEIDEDLVQSASDLRGIEDVLDEGAQRADDDLINEAVQTALKKASKGTDAKAVETTARKEAFDSARVKGWLEDHVISVDALRKAAEDSVTDEEVLEATRAIKRLADDGVQRADVLETYAKSLDKKADDLLAKENAGEGTKAVEALEGLRKTAADLADVRGKSPEAAEYIDAMLDAVRAKNALAQATNEKIRLRNDTSLIDPEKAAKEQSDLLSRGTALQPSESARVAALKAGVATPEGKLRVSGASLMRAQDALNAAEAMVNAATERVRKASAALPDATKKEIKVIAQKAANAIKESSSKTNIEDAVDELAQRAQRATFGTNAARSYQAAARAIRAAQDRALRREVIAVTRFLRKRSELLTRPDVVQEAKKLVSRAKYSADEAEKVKSTLSTEQAVSAAAALEKLAKGIAQKRAAGQAVTWRQSARKIVDGLRTGSERLRARDDISWTDLGWRTGEPRNVTRLRSAAGNAVERALRPLDDNSAGTAEAIEALKSVFGRDTATPELDKMARDLGMYNADAPLDRRAVQVAAQKDIDLAIRKVMSAEESAALTTMQAAWTEKAFMYQMKMFLDPMQSFIGTSSEGLRNVYRGVVGTSQMYFVGLNGAVRKAVAEIRETVAAGGTEDRKQVFAVLMKHINSFVGAADTVSDRGAAVATTSIFARAKRTLVSDAPVTEGDKPAVDAVSGVDRDLLQAARDAEVKFPGGLDAEKVNAATVSKQRAVEKAQEEVDRLKVREAELTARVAQLSAPDPNARPPADLVSMELALSDLLDEAARAKKTLEDLKAADPLSLLDESPLGQKLGELKTAQTEITALAEDLKTAEAAKEAVEAQIKALRARRGAINATSLGAQKTRQVPDDENTLLTKDMRDRLAAVNKAEQDASRAVDDIMLSARQKAYQSTEGVQEVARVSRLQDAVRARLDAARASLAEFPEKAPLGSSNISHRAQRTKRANLVTKYEKELKDLQGELDGFIETRAKALIAADKKTASEFAKAEGALTKAREKVAKADAARAEALEKARTAPLLASPEEVSKARQAIQDQIDALVQGDLAKAADAVEAAGKQVSKKQRVIDGIFKKYEKEIGDDAAKKVALEAYKKEKLAEAQAAFDKADKVARSEKARVEKVTEEADKALLTADERTQAAAKAEAALEEVRAKIPLVEQDLEAKRIEATRFAAEVKAQRESAEAAAREVEIRGRGAVEAAERLAAAEMGQVEPDQTLVRLGLSVLIGIQQAPESEQATKMAARAEKIAREALATSESFEEMYNKILAAWAVKYDMGNAVIGQDAKSMAFAAAALIEGATKDLAVDATLREGIGMVDPRAAKAMARMSRTMSGNVRTGDLTAADVQAAVLGFAKVGQVWNRLVEGTAARPAAFGGAEKSERSLSMYLASVRDIKIDNQTIYLPRALAEGISSEMDLMRKELDVLPTQSPNTFVNKWIIETTRDVMRFVRTSLLVGYYFNPLAYRAKTLLGDTEQTYYAVGGVRAMQVAAAAPLQMIPFRGAVAVDAAHKASGNVAGQIRKGLNLVEQSNMPERVKRTLIDKVGNPLADFIRGTFDPDIGRVIASTADSPNSKMTFGGVTKSRAEWLEEASRQGAFDTNVEAGMRKSIRDVRDMINTVTTRRMTWDDAVEAGRQRGESPYKLYLTRQRVPLKEDDVLSKPGLLGRARTAATELQRALEAREADVQRTSRQLLYFRMRQEGLSENEAGEVMRRGLLDWSHGINRSVSGVIAYMPFWRYHLLSAKQGLSLLFGDNAGVGFDRMQKTLRAYNSLYEGAPEEEEVALVKERARAVARAQGRSEEEADKEVSTFLAARQMALSSVPRFLRDSGQAYGVEHVSGLGFRDLGTGAWASEFDKVDQARRDYRDPEGRTTSWRANSLARSSAIGAIDAAVTMALMMEAAYAWTQDDVQATDAALLKAGTPWLGRLPDIMRTTVENVVLASNPVANAAFGGQRAFSDYGRLSPAEADIAELLGVPLRSTADDPRPMAPKWFNWAFSLPIVEVGVPVVKQGMDIYKAATYSNPLMYGDSTTLRAGATPLAVFGLWKSYGFDPMFNRSMDKAATERAAKEVVKQAEQGTRFFEPR